MEDRWSAGHAELAGDGTNVPAAREPLTPSPRHQHEPAFTFDHVCHVGAPGLQAAAKTSSTGGPPDVPPADCHEFSSAWPWIKTTGDDRRRLVARFTERSWQPRTSVSSHHGPLERAMRTARKKVQDLPAGFPLPRPTALLRKPAHRLWCGRQACLGLSASYQRQDHPGHLWPHLARPRRVHTHRH